MKPVIGDWIAFQKNGTVVLGRILYVKRANSHNHAWTVVTNQGELWEGDILETRRVPVEGGEE